MTCGPFSSPLPLPALPYTDRQPIHRRLKNTFTGSKLYSSFTSRKLVARSSSTKQEARAEAATLEPLRASNTGKDGSLPPVLSTWRTALGDTVGSFREEPALLAITLVYLVQVSVSFVVRELSPPYTPGWAHVHVLTRELCAG